MPKGMITNVHEKLLKPLICCHTHLLYDRRPTAQSQVKFYCPPETISCGTFLSSVRNFQGADGGCHILRNDRRNTKVLCIQLDMHLAPVTIELSILQQKQSFFYFFPSQPVGGKRFSKVDSFRIMNCNACIKSVPFPFPAIGLGCLRQFEAE